MFPKGIIYKFGYPPFGVVRIRVPLHLRILYQTVRGMGAGLIAYAIIFFMFTYGGLIKDEISYFVTGGKVSESYSTLIDKAKAESTAQVQEEAAKLGVNSYFSVVIPKIDAKANIIANVDAANEKEYQAALEEGVAHAKGTYFPGQGRRIYLFSHSTDSPLNYARYNAVFYLLRKLEAGDQIVIFFADKKYIYEVTDKRVVDSNDTSWISTNTDEEDLVLQTCDPPGTTWKRLIVVAKPASVYGGN